ncbi:TetR/AcrR family transcriptional regulator [Mycolicibacterium goodii]|uniref:TetR/AcrR family transcriptional regulator n=1 Tax=Mycolicibacterium goodii TaxID=134601 RepID=UPI001BDD7013|nr:TetR/AcrR family transcriptional regulator [Mycolicibacterium goodii]MBU8816810.1 TetR/AcrR family transcriptional regulator [Mycolicibacterium goodii]
MADELFFNYGFAATGINRIIADSGVAKASFYTAFRSKAELIDAYLEGHHRRLMEQLDQIESSSDNMLAKVNQVFNLLALEVQQPGYRGCLFVVASAELTQNDAMPARRWVRNHKLAVRDCFRRVFISGGLVDPDEMAEEMVILYEGALVTTAVRPESGAVDRARLTSLQLIETAGGPNKRRGLV